LIAIYAWVSLNCCYYCYC